MIKTFLEKITGIDKIKAQAVEDAAKALAIAREAEAAAKEAQQLQEEAEMAAKRAAEEERITKLSPKERATEKKEPWVAVLETHVNQENVKNGFFELDWNEYFVLQLKQQGYQGSNEEEIVDQWFQELCRNVGAEAGVDMERRGSGYINRALRDDGLTEVS
jgi:pyruvate/2-oxoglutarate dehydrogenase complex dihydrolipoamide acyltransferase (E2) component